jgi:hypothetical protein
MSETLNWSLMKHRYTRNHYDYFDPSISRPLPRPWRRAKPLRHRGEHHPGPAAMLHIDISLIITIG